MALSGDYDFQFMIEELAVGAQFKLPYIHVVVNNAYLGLIRQAQRGFDMDFCVQLAFDNINAPEARAGYGVDHVKVAEGLGCKAIRVHEPDELRPGVRAGREADGASTRCRSWSRSSWSASPTSRWAPRSTTSTEFEELAEPRRGRADRDRPARLSVDAMRPEPVEGRSAKVLSLRTSSRAR